MDVGTSGLNISMIKNLLKSTVEQFVQVIVSTALILGGVFLMAANFGGLGAVGRECVGVFGATGADGVGQSETEVNTQSMRPAWLIHVNQVLAVCNQRSSIKSGNQAAECFGKVRTANKKSFNPLSSVT